MTADKLGANEATNNGAPGELNTGREKITLNAHQWDELREMVGNVHSMRQELFRKFMDPRRNYEHECGWPDTGKLSARYYQDLFDRSAIANRIVKVMPRETWQTTPYIWESEDQDTKTGFESSFDMLSRCLMGRKSFYRKQKGNPIWSYLRRADEQARIGTFSIVLYGFDDVGRRDPVTGQTIEFHHPVQSVLNAHKQYDPWMDHEINPGDALAVEKTNSDTYDRQDFLPTDDGDMFSEYAGGTPPDEDSFTDDATERPSQAPADGELPTSSSPQKPKRRLLYLRVFPESLVTVTQYDTDKKSPRYCQPIMYQVTFNDPTLHHTGAGLTTGTHNVHWTRVLHVPGDNLDVSEWFATPALQPVLNNTLDLKKLYGGSAEMYWRGAFPGLALETHPQLGGDVIVDKRKLQDMIENVYQGLERAFILMGMSAKTLAPTVVDPMNQIRVQIEAICINLGIPIRVFMGSERGELASSQDDAAWNDRLKFRQDTYVTPFIIVPFIDRLIHAECVLPPTLVDEFGNLVGYEVEWPDLTSTSEEDRARVALLKTQALGIYVNQNVESLLPPMEYYTRILKETPDAAEAMIQAAIEAGGMQFTEPQSTLPKNVDPALDPTTVPAIPDYGATSTVVSEPVL